MKTDFLECGTRLWRAPFLSPKDLVLRALILGLLFLFAHLAGWREHAAFLSGTVAVEGVDWNRAAFLGTVYLLLYLACILVVPVMLLAAATVTFLDRCRRSHGPGSDFGTTCRE